MILAEAASISETFMTDKLEKLQTVQRRFRFSIRTMLIVVTLACMVCGVVFEFVVRPVLRQRAYQAKWRDLGSTLNQDASCDEEVAWLDFHGRTYGALNLTEIPLEIGNLSNLISLEVGSRQLAVLPPEIGKLQNLKTLHVFSHHLTEIPLEIGNLSNLISLEVGSRQLTVLPPDIGNLTNLESMRLSFPQLQEFPAEIGNLTKLKAMELTNDPITDTDLEIMKSLKNLERLHLSGTQVTKEGVESLQKSIPNCKIWSNFESP
ncbi:MAG: hypothetical protein ACI9HK_003260 [Pirellulaceae bacterium]|jgi:hypothetical protein